MNCEICNNKVSKVLINLGSQPIPDNLSKNLKTSLNKKKFNTKIVYCEKCITAYQYLTIKKQKLFTANYSYRARNTKDVVNGLKALSEEIKKKIQNKKKIKILDIGCNDGTLLDFFSSKSYETFGIEPTNAYKDCDKRHTVLNRFFDKKTAKYFLKNYGSPDIIVFTNVFAHIEKFKLLIKNLKYLKKKETIIVIENHYLISVLKKFQFDTFYHEHLRTYSLNSFFYISKLLNMKITKFSFPKRYGGNIRI